MLTRLGTGHAELATDACGKQGFAWCTQPRQSPAAQVSPGLLAPVLSRAGVLGCGAGSCMGSAEEGLSVSWGISTPATSDRTRSVSVTLAGGGTPGSLSCVLCS